MTQWLPMSCPPDCIERAAGATHAHAVPTVRESDRRHLAQEYPDADEMAMASTPWMRDIVRNPGDYVGVHRLSYTWAVHFVDGYPYRINIGMGARR